MDHDHFGPDCPQCQAQADACKAIGGIVEAWQAMLEDGVFHRMGFEAGMRRERDVLAAFLSCPVEEIISDEEIRQRAMEVYPSRSKT